MPRLSVGSRPLACAALGLLLAPAAPARAVPAVQTGLVGLARFQTARLNAVNLRASRSVPPNPCVATLSFLDGTGRVFVDRLGQPVALDVRMQRGESAALELPSSIAFLGRPGLRQAFRAAVEVNPGPPEDPDPCVGLVTTLEVYDEHSGRTSVMSQPGPPNVEVQPGPPNSGLPNSGLPSFGLLGLARLQTARVSLVNLTPPDGELPPGPCHVALRFLDDTDAPFQDRSGSPVASEASLSFGEAAVLHLPASTAFIGRPGSRRSFRVSVEQQPGPPTAPPNPCAGAVPTLEIFDNLTGRTSVLYTNPGPESLGSQPGPPTAREATR